MRFAFDATAQRELPVTYRRDLREGDARAKFGGTWCWRVSHARNTWFFRPHDVRMQLPVDSRPVLPHRALFEPLRDQPLSWRVTEEGFFREVVDTDDFARRAGVSEASLAALSPEGRAVVEHAASWHGQQAAARDFWQGWAAVLVEVGELEDGECGVTTVPWVSIPALGTSMSFLLSTEARALPDGLWHLRWRTEPDPALLQQAMAQQVDRRVEHFVHQTTTELWTRPQTLRPHRIHIVRETQMAGEGLLTTDRVEVREWSFGD